MKDLSIVVLTALQEVIENNIKLWNVKKFRETEEALKRQIGKYTENKGFSVALKETMETLGEILEFIEYCEDQCGLWTEYFRYGSRSDYLNNTHSLDTRFAKIKEYISNKYSMVNFALRLRRADCVIIENIRYFDLECAERWELYTNNAKIPEAAPINTTLSPEEVKDIAALHDTAITITELDGLRKVHLVLEQLMNVIEYEAIGDDTILCIPEVEKKINEYIKTNKKFKHDKPKKEEKMKVESGIVLTTLEEMMIDFTKEGKKDISRLQAMQEAVSKILHRYVNNLGIAVIRNRDIHQDDKVEGKAVLEISEVVNTMCAIASSDNDYEDAIEETVLHNKIASIRKILEMEPKYKKIKLTDLRRELELKRGVIDNELKMYINNIGIDTIRKIDTPKEERLMGLGLLDIKNFIQQLLSVAEFEAGEDDLGWTFNRVGKALHEYRETVKLFDIEPCDEPDKEDAENSDDIEDNSEANLFDIYMESNINKDLPNHSESTTFIKTDKDRLGFFESSPHKNTKKDEE